MTDKKFTQKEVINALELCTNKEIFVCDQCVFQKYKMAHNGCLAELLPSALDLINRLKVRIKRYQLKNTNQRNALASLNKKVAEQKAEIERVQREIESCNSENAELRHKIASCYLENVELKAEIDRLLHSLDETNKYIPKIKERAKSETIKEVLLTLETAVEESDKYIREYEDSKEQRAYNKGLRDAYNLVKETMEGKE